METQIIGAQRPHLFFLYNASREPQPYEYIRLPNTVITERTHSSQVLLLFF